MFPKNNSWMLNSFEVMFWILLMNLAVMAIIFIGKFTLLLIFTDMRKWF